MSKASKAAYKKLKRSNVFIIHKLVKWQFFFISFVCWRLQVTLVIRNYNYLEIDPSIRIWNRKKPGEEPGMVVGGKRVSDV